jgi:hypothetical protein
MPARKYLKKNPGREAVLKSVGKDIYKGVKVPKKDRVVVPRNLRGIQNQAEREKKMLQYLDKVPDSMINNIFKSYPLLEKTADGETFSQMAAVVKLKRQMKKK